MIRLQARPGFLERPDRKIKSTLYDAPYFFCISLSLINILQNGSKNTKVKITKRQPHQFSQWFQGGEEQGKGRVQWGGKSKCVIRVNKIQGPDWPDNEGKFFIQLALIGPVFIRFWSRPFSSIGRISDLPHPAPFKSSDGNAPPLFHTTSSPSGRCPA